MKVKIPQKQECDWNELKKELEKISSSMENDNNVNVIKTHIEVLILTQIRTMNLSFTFTKDEILEMISVAVFYYLMVWMEKSCSNRQSIYHFVLEKYLIKTEQEDFNNNGFEKTLDEEQRKKYHKMLRAVPILRDNNTLQNEQAKLEGNKYSRIAYKTNKTAFYRFSDLFFFDNYSDGRLKLYYWLYYSDINRDNSIIKNELKEAYYCFNQLLESLYEIESSRETVITYMGLYKFEIDHRFILSYKLGKYMNDNNISIDKELPPYILNFICRDNYDLSEEYKIGSSLLLYNYDDLIRNAYTHSVCRIYISKIKAKREIIAKVISLYNKTYPEKIKKPWSEKDFEDAYRFLFNSAEILECFDPLNLDECNAESVERSVVQNNADVEQPVGSNNNKNQYDYIINIYKNPDFFDQELLDKTRKKLREKRYNRNKK